MNVNIAELAKTVYVAVYGLAFGLAIYIAREKLASAFVFFRKFELAVWDLETAVAGSITASSLVSTTINGNDRGEVYLMVAMVYWIAYLYKEKCSVPDFIQQLMLSMLAILIGMGFYLYYQEKSMQELGVSSLQLYFSLAYFIAVIVIYVIAGLNKRGKDNEEKVQRRRA